MRISAARRWRQQSVEKTMRLWLRGPASWKYTRSLARTCPAVILFAVAPCPAVFGCDVDHVGSVYHVFATPYRPLILPFASASLTITVSPAAWARASAGALAGSSRFQVACTGVKQVERDCDVDGPRSVAPRDRHSDGGAILAHSPQGPPTQIVPPSRPAKGHLPRQATSPVPDGLRELIALPCRRVSPCRRFPVAPQPRPHRPRGPAPLRPERARREGSGFPLPRR
jgi:hypothetical protein